jgi:hypothetical protein
VHTKLVESHRAHILLISILIGSGFNTSEQNLAEIHAIEIYFQNLFGSWSLRARTLRSVPIWG